MLPIEYRLKKRKQFNYIHKNGKYVGGEFLGVVYCAGGKIPNAKFGFSASKKVGNSVIRHRAVRLMREAAKPFIKSADQKNNYIIVAKEGIEKQHLLYITLDLEKVLKRCSVL